MNPTLAELYERYDRCIELRPAFAKARLELEAAEAELNQKIEAAKAGIEEWYARKNLVMIDIADKEKEF